MGGDTDNTKRHKKVDSNPAQRAIARNVLFWFGLLLAGTLVPGWYFIQLFAGYGEGLERQALLVTASTAAASFDGAEVARLKGSADDLDTHAFAQARESLQRMRAAVPGSRFAYLLALRHGYVVFLADAEPTDSPSYSRPGDVYVEASPAMRLVFATATAATEGPLLDHWGEWVSGLAPVLDPKTGDVVAVFGVDISADHWKATVARFRWLGVAASGFLAGVILFFGLLVYRQYQLRAKLTVADRIVKNSTAVLYRLGGARSLPMTFISSNVAKLGYEPREFLASPYFYRSVVHPDDRAGVEEFTRRLLKDGAGPESIQFRVCAKDGTFR